MRTFSKGRLARSIAYLLTVTVLFSFTGIGALPAAAQVVTRAATSQTVAVLPFYNKTSFRPETLGDEAAATVSVELRDRLLLDVLPKADVALQMSDLGLKVPLSEAEMVRLATELDLTLLVAGEVRGARIVKTRTERYAEVVLAVRLFDRIARTDVNGAVAIGKGPGSPEMSDDELMAKAMEQAAFSAVEQMKSRPTITAMVLWARGDFVFLNVGTRGGLRPGVKLVAVRGGERIGLVEVTESDAIGSYAKSVEGPPLRTGDSLRAVYKLPEGVKVERVGVSEARKKTFETYALLAGIVFGFGGFASRTRKVEEGNIAAPNFRVRQLANGNELGVSGYLPSLTPTRDIHPTAATLVSWDGYQGSEGTRILGYDVRRSGEIVGILTGGPSGVTFIDGAEPPGVMVVEITIDPVLGSITELLVEFTQWLPTEVDPDTGELTNPTYADFVDSNADLTNAEASEDFRHYGWFTGDGDELGGVIPGVLYQYQVAPILIHQVQAGGTLDWEFASSEFSTVANIIAAVAPAGTFDKDFRFITQSGPYEIREPVSNPEIISNIANFVFYYPYGADEIILQIARDPNVTFSAAGGVLTLHIPPSGPNYNSDDPQDHDKARIDGIDLSRVPGTGLLFWWRIGARNSFDTHTPEAYPIDSPQDRGFVYSQRNAFSITSTTTRADAMHEQREALEAVRAARTARSARVSRTDRVLKAQ